MINKLIETPIESLNVYYLSHPISEIRKEAERYQSSFIGKLESLIESIIQNSNTVLFYPTSIDELIIKQEKEDHKTKLSPILSQRWGIPFRDSIISPPIPNHLTKINPLNPQNFDFLSEGNDSENAISHLLSLLREYIYHTQTVSRDFSLIEQCRNGIIVCRPFYNGSLGNGVKAEIEYNYSLMRDSKKRRCYKLSCDDDNDEYRANKVCSLLSEKIEDEKKIDLLKKELSQNSDCFKSEKDFLSIINKKIPIDSFITEDETPNIWEGESHYQKTEAFKTFLKNIFIKANEANFFKMEGEKEIQSDLYKRTFNLNYTKETFWNELIAEIGSKIEYPEEV